MRRREMSLIADPLSPGVHAAEQALIEASRALTIHLDLESVCEAILASVETIFDARASWVLLHDPSAGVLRTRVFRGECAETYRGVAVPDHAGVIGLAFTRREVVFVPNVVEEDRWFDAARMHRSGLRSIFMIPLLRQGTAVGVMGLDSPRFNADHPPRPIDIARLEALASQAAIAIANAQLYEDSEQDRRRLRALVNERRRLRGEVSQLRDEIRDAYSFGNIVGSDSSLLELLRQAELVATADTTVLLLGETGTGKELIARLLHDWSHRRPRPFVPVNCAALPEALVESELFGHERGAFTGAVSRKPGKFEIANGGTLFLDEIGDLPSDAQAKLLRVLQDSQVQRVGSTQTVAVDVRLIAATNMDLEEAIEARRFRSDLFYRISVFPMRIPSLRERPGDIPALVDHYLAFFSRKLRKAVTSIEPAALDRLMTYSWPGNIRELQNVVERAVILSSGTTVQTDVLSLNDSVKLPRIERRVMTFAAAERDAIRAALVATKGRINGPGGAAVLLRLKPSTLRAKMKRLDIERDRPPESGGA
jgi:formate hydrogenlyase transcriptional activator